MPYKNAVFYCDSTEKRMQISCEMCELFEEHGIGYELVSVKQRTPIMIVNGKFYHAQDLTVPRFREELVKKLQDVSSPRT